MIAKKEFCKNIHYHKTNILTFWAASKIFRIFSRHFDQLCFEFKTQSKLSQPQFFHKKGKDWAQTRSGFFRKYLAVWPWSTRTLSKFIFWYFCMKKAIGLVVDIIVSFVWTFEPLVGLVGDKHSSHRSPEAWDELLWLSSSKRKKAQMKRKALIPSQRFSYENGAKRG